LAAALYSSVGQGGGSGYLAVMALFSLAPEVMRPAALSMNLVVSSVVWWRLHRKGYFRADLFWPFAMTSMPTAFVGGALRLDAIPYRILVGSALAIAAIRLLSRPPDLLQLRVPTRVPALAYGAGMGLVSGITGVGGGIFLTPLLLFLRWCTLKESFALAAAFIWANSLSAMIGYAWSDQPWPDLMPVMMVVALFGTLGGILWSERLAKPVALQRVLGVVLVFTAVKMIAGW
jgi:uncharacterized membrane protein YfcA